MFTSQHGTPYIATHLSDGGVLAWQTLNDARVSAHGESHYVARIKTRVSTTRERLTKMRDGGEVPPSVEKSGHYDSKKEVEPGITLPRGYYVSLIHYMRVSESAEASGVDVVDAVTNALRDAPMDFLDVPARDDLRDEVVAFLEHSGAATEKMIAPLPESGIIVPFRVHQSPMSGGSLSDLLGSLKKG